MGHNKQTPNFPSFPPSIFVPLCGKSGCLLHLYNSGHTVVGRKHSACTGVSVIPASGAEAVESVVEQFFAENQLEVTKSEIPGIEVGQVKGDRGSSDAMVAGSPVRNP